MKYRKYFNLKKYVVMTILVVLAIAGAAFGAYFGLGERDVPIVRAEDPKRTLTIHSATEFNTYASDYLAGNCNRQDTLVFSISSGNTLSTDGYISLGTESRPFEGTIVIPTAGKDTFYLFDCPLFDYVSTDMTVSGAGVIKIERERANGTPAANVLTSGALFANHVVKGSKAANWTINLLAYDNVDGNGDNESASFDCLIGDIAANAEVNITYSSTKNISVEGTGNTGLICGTLNAGATLGVKTTAGPASTVSVSSSGGHAGGLVGEMKAGSTLRFDSGNNTNVASVSTSAANSYAGGIVGYLDDGVIAFKQATLEDLVAVTDYTVKGSVTGTKGAGGLYGYYKASTNAVKTITLADYTITSGMTMSATNYVGGVIGELNNLSTAFTFNGNAELTTVTLNDGTYRGGFVGFYSTSALSNTLTITNVRNNVSSGGTSSGGLVGGISDKAYVLIDGATGAITTAGSSKGGLVGNAGTGGSFIDVKGTITISGTHTGGLVDVFTNGVLRIRGTTDLSGTTFANVTDGAVVRSRDRTLVYALGTGSDAGWSLKRKNTTECDDIYSWGQVIRVDGTNLVESDLFTVDDVTAHTVTIKQAYTTMDTLTKFALTALNIKLNTGADVGALKFTSGDANTSATLLAGTLTLGANINLTDTGITGFTRDDGKNNVFTGSLAGGGNTITLDTGTRFGGHTAGTDSSVTDYKGLGGIHNHSYTGLFAKAGTTGGGVAIGNLTVTGNLRIRSNGDVRYVGALVASVVNKVTFTSVTDSTAVAVKCTTSGYCYLGGAVGIVNANGQVTVTGGTYGMAVTDDTNTVADDKDKEVVFGGVIGCVDGEGQTISIGSSAALNASYTKTAATRIPYFGAAIGRIAHVNYSMGTRTVTINDVTVNFVASATPKSDSKKTGAILGTDWYSADVTITGLVIGASTSVTTTTNAADIGGLVQTATGHWDIVSVGVTSGASITAPSGSTFGFVANKAYYKGNTTVGSSALYLDIDNTGSNYDIANLNVDTASGTFAVFDEVVADSRFMNSNSTVIKDNGQAIVSIKTSGSTISAAQLTYLNKTTYGKDHSCINQYTRYYYNLKSIRENGSASDAQKFLIWSVKVYAHSSLSGWFTKSSFTGTLDMTGLSYYPIHLNGTNVTFTNATVTLDNNTMESRVNYVKTDTTGRSTRASDNQHYLMHTSLFLNVTSTITINGLTIAGNVPKLSDNHCGFLVAGTLGGTTGGMVTYTAASSNIIFEGAYITEGGNQLTSSSTYAPLFINKVAQNTTIEIKGIKQSTTKTESGNTKSKYCVLVENSKYAASSLIGDVGNSTARSIRLSFAEMVFDARKAAISDGTANGNMTTAYGTSRSIFSRATVLNSFVYYGESSGTYNFPWSDDWTDATTAKYQVTYGREITASIENPDRQNKYYADASGRYVDPTSGTHTAAPAYAEFTQAKFLSYVYTKWDSETTPTAMADFHHELAVNISVTVTITGCGKYADPYIIDEDNKLDYIANIIYGAAENISQTAYLTLPYSYSTFTCDNSSNADTAYRFNGSYFKDPDDLDAVREYLAGAYYKITASIKLSATFPGLGAVSENAYATTYSCPFAFRGVIVGADDEIQITNYSQNPLIYSANGCVVKDVTVAVNSTITLSQATLAAEDTVFQSNAALKYKSGMQTYGAVIGQVMGGDNIIDGVSVNYSSATIIWSDSTNTRVIPVGGYVGSLLSGGLIFRNYADKNDTALAAAGNLSGKVSGDGSETWLYVNPIIGRVIAGYAFYETTAYHYLESTCKVNNGTKNYSIPDLNTSGSTLGVRYEYVDSTNKFYVTIPDGQAIFVLASIINCGAASAPYKGGAEQAYTDVNIVGKIPGSGSNVKFVTATGNGYRAYTTARGLSDYSTLGSSSGDQYTYASTDAYTSNANKVPYIIRKYTSYTNTSRFAARCLGYYQLEEIEVTGNCYTPESFRGIGNMYDGTTNIQIGGKYDTTAQYVRIGFTTFKGTKDGSGNVTTTVTLNTKYYEYNYDRGIAYKFKTDYNVTNSSNYNGEMAVRSIGLFNQVYDSDETIQDLKIAGHVETDLLNKSTGRSITYGFGQTDDNGIGQFDGVAVSVGGLCGFVYNKKLTIKDVDFSGAFSVKGAKWAGGYVGASRVGTLNIENCDTCAESTLSVSAGHQAGGFVAWNRESTININKTTGTSSISLGTISVFGKIDTNTNAINYAPTDYGDKDSNNNGLYSVGGCIAYGRSVTLYLRNVTLTGGEIKFTDLTDDSAAGLAGGLVGSAFTNNYTEISDNTISGVDICGEVTGGICGGFGNNSKAITVYNCVLNGNSKAATISGGNKVGGVFGYMHNKSGGDGAVKVYSTKIIGYNISQTYEGTDWYSHASDKDDKVQPKSQMISGAGGIVGHIRFDPTPDNFSIYDVTITGCDISSSYNSTHGGSDYKGTGGLVGVTNNAGTVKGYNVLLDDTMIHNDNNINYGIFVGKNNGNNGRFKFVGLSFDDITTNGTDEILGDALITGQMLVNASSYAVFADYNVTADYTGATGNTTFSTVGSGYTNVASASPYATANPATTFGGITLTGDGVAATVNGLTIQQILYDTADYKYSYAAKYNYDGSSAPTTYDLFNNNYLGQLKMFKTEVPEYTGTDFPVYIIESNDSATITKMINSYLRLLTNTRLSFEASETAKFEVAIYRMECSAGTFTVNDDKVSLKINTVGSRYFYTNNNTYDSGAANPQFTLIDVWFKDPTSATPETGAVAYHLYVPVYIKRVLNYKFEISVESGTTYIESAYSSSYGNPLIENVGSPVTAYFKYTYQRSAEDWALAVNGGEDVERNFGKSLIFYKANNNDILKDFPANTVLVLVDPNNGGKAYYSKIGTALDGNVLDLTAFKSEMDKDGGGNLTFDGDTFAPVNLDTLLTTLVVGEASGGPLVRCDAASATFYYDEYYYRPAEVGDEGTHYRAYVKGAGATRNDVSGAYVSADAATGTVKIDTAYYRAYADGDSTPRYDITLNGGGSIGAYKLEERYYLSIFTESAVDYDKFHYYLITSPSSLTDAVYPSKISDTGADTMVHLVMGKIFDHGDFTVTSESEGRTATMSPTNNTLNISLSASMGISSSLDSEIKTDVENLISAPEVQVYHSFMVYLNRKEDEVTAKAILGSPSASGNYTVYLYKRMTAAQIDATEGDPEYVAPANRFNASGTQSASGNYTDRNAARDAALTGSDDYDWFDGVKYYRELTAAELAAESSDPEYVAPANRYNVTFSQANDGIYMIDGESAYSVGNIHKTQNYVEFVSSDLSDNFVTGHSFTVEATVSLGYSAGAIGTQFPGRPSDLSTNGVSVSGSSNIAFSADKTTYSKNIQSGDEDPAQWYYSEEEPETATLYLNAKGDKEGDFTSLGINALNIDGADHAIFDLSADLEVTAVLSSVEDFSSVLIMVTLSQKQASGAYGDPLDISEYITSLTVEGIAPARVVDDGTAYYIVLNNKEVNFENHAEVLMPLLKFRVKTGSALESAGQLYSNYKVSVTVTLRHDNAVENAEGDYVRDESGTIVARSDSHKYRLYNAGTDGGMTRYDIDAQHNAIVNADGAYVRDDENGTVVAMFAYKYRLYNAGTDGGMTRYEIDTQTIGPSVSSNYVIYTNAKIIPDFIS